MPPAGAGKRKRGDRSWSGDSGPDGQRPSPHRPNNLNLAQQNQSPNHARDSSDSRGRGMRRASRGGGRGGNSQARSPVNGSTPMSPPPQKTPMPAATEGRELTSTPQPMTPQPTTRPATPQTRPQDTWTPTVIEPIEPRPFNYEYITDEIAKTWEDEGRASILQVAKDSIKDKNMLLLSSLLQELIQSTLDVRIDAASAGSVVKEMLALEQRTEDDSMEVEDTSLSSTINVQTIFLDTLSILAESGATDGTGKSIQRLVSATGISADALRIELQIPLLVKMWLVRDTFERMGIRKQTNLLYRQANFNLLREESEGFAKLMTELFTTSEKGTSNDAVDETVQRVKATIGAFDLDVGKTLDVVLDIFGSVLVKQYRFFVRFLRRSPWWPREDDRSRTDTLRIGGLPMWAQPESSKPSTTEEQRALFLTRVEERDRKFWDRVREIGLSAFFELGQRPASDWHRKNGIPAWNGAQPDDEADIRKWIEETGTIPPQGNHDAAQLLGFKLRFYSSSAARSQADTLPENLIYLSALLIKIGFVSLKDLYPHLWRPDEDMEALRQQKLKEKTERELAARPGAGARNALLLAGALSDDTLPVPTRLRESDTRAATPSREAEADKTKKPEEVEEPLPEPADQKVLLLKSLLAIGALPEALFILGRFPWLTDLYPEMPEYIHRIIHHSLSKVYEPLRPLGERHSLREQQRLTDDQAGIPKGQIKLIDAPVRKTMRWAHLDKEDSGIDGMDYRFYWDDWADNVPICQTVDDVFALCDTFLNLSGVKIGQDSSLLVKLARIGKDSISKDNSESNRLRWTKLCKRLLVPALSLTKANPGVINEVFDLISTFSRETRYMIYTEWFTGRTSRNPDIKAAFDLARAETKDVLKRLSKTNAKPTARTLAKIAYANPGIVINVALGQIEAYDNFAEVVTEGARYFTFLGYDVLSWSLVSSLGRAGRSRVQEGGLLTSRWLSALALFAGKVFKRYSTLNPVPILQYVAHQLRNGNSTDLIVLEQMILLMAGIVTDTNYNESQLQAMGGGPLLQSQTILQLLDKRHDPAMKASSRRLMRGLRDSGLVGQLLLLIAQQRRMCIYSVDDADAPLKLLGNIFDEIHRILVQYLDLLKSNLTLEEFMTFVPNVTELISQYGIEPEVAFWISRQTIVHQMLEFERANPGLFGKKRADSTLKESVDTDVEMKDETTPIEGSQAGEVNGTGHENGTPIGGLETGETNNDGATPMKEESPEPEAELETVSRIWHPVLEDIMEATRPSLPEEIPTVIGLPFYMTFWQLSLYDLNIPRKAYETESERARKLIVSNNNDRSDLKRRDERKKQLSELNDNLLGEYGQHLKSFVETKTRLLREKDHWFKDMFQKHEALNLALMEYCFLPRISLSPLDAFFCFKMIKFMHTNGTLNFRTLGFYDLIFREARLTSLIFSCSSKEADNLGRFLNEILRDLSRWHKDKKDYDKEACGVKKSLPGFAKKVASTGKPETFLDYEDFRKILYKWHSVMHKAIKNCLTSTDYMHIRNAISVLKAISQHFPAVNWIGTSLQSVVSDLQKSDKEDVRVPSAALMGDLNRREKEWMIPQAFRQGDELNAANASKRPVSQPTKSLNAEAVEFKPTASEQTSAEAEVPASNGAEDGEVDDSEMADVDSKKQDVADSSLSEVKVESSTNISEEESVAISQAAKQAADDATKLQVKTEAPSTSSRSSTPAAKESQPNNRTESGTRSASIPRRPDSARSTSVPTSNPNLPSRPERTDSRNLRANEARIPNRLPDASHDRRDQRGANAEFPRSERHEDRTRDRQPPNGTRLAERPSYERLDARESSHRDYPGDRHQQPPGRESRPRDDHPGRSPRHGTSSEPHSRRSDIRSGDRDVAMPPPQVPPSQATAINPERAALINQAAEGQADVPGKRQNDDRTRGSRQSSPRRGDERAQRHSDRRDGPPEDRRFSRYEQDSRHRVDDGRLSHKDFPLDGPTNTRRPPVDMNHGRLNEDSRYPPRRRDDDGSDRGHSSEFPSGPRNRDSSSLQSQDRQPPSGPGRSRGRSDSFQDHGSSTSQTSSDAIGIHPDRLKAFQSPTTEQSPNRMDRSDSRLAPSTPNQTSPPAAPAGPRNSSNNASGPSSANRGPPSGPQFNDGGRGRGQRSTLSTVNNTLQQAGQGTSIRGRGAARTASMPVTPHQNEPPTPTSAPNSGRPDLFASTPRHGDKGSETREDRAPPSGRRGELMEEEQVSRRSSRHSNSSRGHSADRENGSSRRDREGHRENDRERDRDREKERSERDRGHDREARDGHREREREREPRESSSRREGREGRDHTSTSQSSAPPPTRRSGRREDLMPQPSPSQSQPRGPPLPPQAFEASEHTRRSGGFPPSDRTQYRTDERPSRGNAERPYEARDGGHRERDRERDRDREYDRERTRGGPPPGPAGGTPATGPASITPQKRGRPSDDTIPPAGGPPGEGGGRGGYGRGPSRGSGFGSGPGSGGRDSRGSGNASNMGPGNENKRPRRGP